MSRLLLGGATALTVFPPESVDLDGTNDFFSRSSDLIGNADGKTFTFSFWIYITAEAQEFVYYSGNGTTDRVVVRVVSGTTQFLCFNSSDTKVLDARVPPLPANTYSHFVISGDMNDSGTIQAYVDDTVQTVSLLTYVDSTIGFTATDHTLGSELTGTLLKGRLSDVFMDYTFRDLSIEANRRLFTTISTDRGLIPAEGQAALNPIMYLPMDDPATAFINLGTGGDFVQNGTIARSNRGPNQYNAVASEFDGSADFLNSAGVGASDSKTATISFIVTPDFSGASPTKYIFTVTAGGSTRFDVFGNTSGSITLNSRDSGNASNMLTTLADVFNDKASVHISVSFDLTDANKRFVFVNGVLFDAVWSQYTDSLMGLSGNPLLISRDLVGSFDYKGSIGEVYFDTAYIDLSVNNPFWDIKTNKPKYLGENGERPTGSIPLVYLPIRADGPGNNLGTGGDFTVNSGPFVGARGGSEFIARGAIVDGTNYLTGNVFCKSLVKWKSTDSGVTWVVSYSNDVTVTDIGNGTDNGVVAYYFGTAEDINFALESETLRFTDALGFPIKPKFSQAVLYLDFSDTLNFGLNQFGDDFVETGTITPGADVNA